MFQQSGNQENKAPLDTFWEVQLVRKKVQADNSLELQSGSIGLCVFNESRLVVTILTILGVTEICCFRLVLGGKTCKEITD